MGILSSIFGGSGKKAAAAATQAAGVAGGAQQNALDYLMAEDQMPSDIREGALSGLAGYFGVPGFGNTQQQVIDEARMSPLYQAIMGGRKSGEDSIMRHASMTGGLRSGNVQSNLYDYNTQLENDALLQSVNQRLGGLGGLMKLPSNANNIAGLTSDIGMTEAMGITGAAQAREQAKQNRFGNIMSIGKLGLQAGMAFSDIRLKTNIRPVGEKNGWKWYEWDWIPEALELGLSGRSQGVLAHHVYERKPEAIGLHKGFLMVDYDMLGVA